jgi:hypothetical protein
MSDDLYDETVVILRDITENHDAASRAAGRPRDRLRAQPDRPMLDVLGEHWAEEDDLAAFRRKIEDVAIRALERLESSLDYPSVVAAIEAASVGWLYPVLLERAVETPPPDAGGED